MNIIIICVCGFTVILIFLQLLGIFNPRYGLVGSVSGVLMTALGIFLSIFLYQHPLQNHGGKHSEEQPGRSFSKNHTIQMIAVLLSVLGIAGVITILVRNKINDPPPVTASPSITEEPFSSLSPSLQPAVEEIKIFYRNEEKTEFTIRMGWEPVKLRAVAYPQNLFDEAEFTWECSNEACLKITISDDTQFCVCEIIQPSLEPVELTASCNGVKRTIIILLR